MSMSVVTGSREGYGISYSMPPVRSRAIGVLLLFNLYCFVLRLPCNTDTFLQKFIGFSAHLFSLEGEKSHTHY